MAKDIDQLLKDFHRENRLLKEELSLEENLSNVIEKLDDKSKDKVLAYAVDLYYSHKYQTNITEVPILDIKLKD